MNSIEKDRIKVTLLAVLLTAIVYLTGFAISEVSNGNVQPDIEFALSK